MFIVVGYNELTGERLPDGSFARINGTVYPFMQGNSYTNYVAPFLPGGVYTVEVVSGQAGWIPIDDPEQPDQIEEVDSFYYGNPRRVVAQQVAIGLAIDEGQGILEFG